MNKKVLVVGEPTAEQVKAWKKEHGDIVRICVNVKEGEQSVGYLKSPGRDVSARAMSMFTQQKVLETGEFIIQNCWLGGDERIKNDEKISMAAAVEANRLIEFLEATLEKL
ncbi:MAG: hypothetical protein GC192_23490 [Bacteroidetes bacterium]|nr:hypothetical protein [Bacteroidota bacterium]